MKIIDFHAHVFHPKIAHLAIKKLEEHYGYSWQGDGTDKELSEIIGEYDARAVVFSTSTKPQQTKINNDYLLSLKNDCFIVLGSVHPDYENLKEEIARVKNAGLKGFKFHPDFQQFDIDSGKALKMYEIIGSDFPIVLHVGDKKLKYSSPERLSRVLEIFPQHKFVAAHMGGYSVWNSEAKYLLGKKLWIDTSSTMHAVSDVKMVEMIRLHGADRVLFGTDYPAVNLKNELERFEKLKLKKSDKEKILHLNAEKLLKL